MTHLKKILVPFDFSPHSLHAFEIAWSLARDYGGRLVVLHVIPPPVGVAPEVGVLPYSTEEEEHALLGRLCGLKGAGADVPVECLLKKGPPADVIVREAGEHQCDLIVMGTHGRTGLGRLLMGSVAEHVLRHAPCPVMTIRGEAHMPAAAVK